MGQVVTGIGFIGAGTIIHHGTTVKGLTTAATIWCSAGVGCLAAFDKFQELAIIVGIIIIVNLAFGALDRYLKRKGKREENGKETKTS